MHFILHLKHRRLLAATGTVLLLDIMLTSYSLATRLEKLLVLTYIGTCLTDRIGNRQLVTAENTDWTFAIGLS